nr:unnamed protein product [Spirometra erinaceieuropaei]
MRTLSTSRLISPEFQLFRWCLLWPYAPRELYFCRHCYDVRCGNCVSHEVDSHYCPNCLENMASAEAKMRRHRCGNCFDCPSCGHNLSTRATIVLVPSAEGSASKDASKSTPQKVYYLTCNFCRWSTRDSGIVDQTTPAGGWQESPNPHEHRVEELVAAYRQLAVKEKNERERSKYVRKRNYMLLMEKYPVLTPRFRRCRPSTFGSFGGSHDQLVPRDTEPAVEISIPGVKAEPITESFNVDDFVKKPLKIETVTSLFQRYMSPKTQPTSIGQLEPRHKALAVKRSLRCRQCEHNLSKADFNPSAIKFRINLSAFQHVPDLRICLPTQCIASAGTGTATAAALPSATAYDPSRPLPLGLPNRTLPVLTFASVPAASINLQGFAVGKTTNVVLTLSNPAHRVTTVRLCQLSTDEEAAKLAACLTSSSGLAEICEDATIYSTARLTLPSESIRLAAKSDVTEYDDLATTTSNEFKDDDPKVIAFRQGNKVGVHVGVTPMPAGSGKTEPQPVRAVIQMTFDYQNTTSSMLSEQRAVAASAVLAASGIATNGKADAPPTAAGDQSTTSEEELRDINLLFFVDFGEIFYKVAVEGNIGCGKSTFLKYFESLSSNIEVSLEPIELWNNVKGHKLFEMFYADPGTWSSPLQSQVMVTYLHRQATPQSAPVRLIERSLHSGRHCFIEAIRENNQISDGDLEVLHEFYKFGRDMPFCKLDLIVYLRSSPEVCADRIRRRHRRGEEGISMDYLQQLHDLHEKWLLSGKNDDCPAPVLVFDCDEPLETITNAYYERREQVMCGVKS